MENAMTGIASQSMYPAWRILKLHPFHTETRRNMRLFMEKVENTEDMAQVTRAIQ
jgi:hypothetical protein